MSDYEAMRAMYFKLVREQSNTIDALQKILSNLTLAMQEAEEIWVNADSSKLIAFPGLHIEDQPTAEK